MFHLIHREADPLPFAKRQKKRPMQEVYSPVSGAIY